MNSISKIIRSREARILWTLSALASAALLLLAFAVSPAALDGERFASFSALVRRHHGEDRCLLCGMSHSLSLIARGDFQLAQRLNPLGLPLYAALAANCAAGTLALFSKAGGN